MDNMMPFGGYIRQKKKNSSNDIQVNINHSEH